MTNITFLSHASILVESNGKKIIVDPWLIGSCYWRSWWNYPPVDPDLIKNLKVDAVYLTHVHWDHWHGPSLKKFFNKDTLIITHDEPNKRSINDLGALGFQNLKLLKHGQSFKIGDIKIYAYQFGLFLNDSALVIETPKMKLLNANDCKIAGSSLRSIINRHGDFDFALRSHSSANDRVCYTIENDVYENDDMNHYTRSFALFMNAVKPKYAIPFASNHCHLHKDVYELNHIVNNPFKLSDSIRSNKLMQYSELKILLSGDSWNSENGFQIDNSKEDYFRNMDYHLSEYKDSVEEKLQLFYKQENRLKPTKRIIKMFSDQINTIPKLFRNKFISFSYKLSLHNDTKEWNYIVKPYTGEVIECENLYNNGSEVRIPIKIFIDSVSMNMFHHSSISKRNRYIFADKYKLKKYEEFQDLLEYVELEVFPLRFSYIKNMIFSYSRRWRELFVYIKAFVLKKQGMELYQIEEEILKNT